MTGKRKREPWWTAEPKINRHPALKIACPHCEVPAGTLCIGARMVHPARFEAWYKQQYPAPKDTT